MQRWTPTIEALVVPDIDASLDEQGAKRDVLGRVPRHRRLAPGAASLLIASRSAGAGRVKRATASMWGVCGNMSTGRTHSSV